MRRHAASRGELRPLITHLVVTRRCNLACTYCFEYDDVSAPVPLATLKSRIDHLARLRSVFVTLTGGESLLHPDIVELVRHVRERGMTPFLNTNGFLLTQPIIEALNAAGLYGMQLSIDNARPNAVSKKSLKTLAPKLRLLKRHAAFHVRVNTVIGSSPPAEALEVARAVTALGFDSNISLVRQASGALVPPSPETRAAYDEIRALGRARLPSFMDDRYTQTLLADGEMTWRCRAGARTFLVDEHGVVHLCQPRADSAGTPLAAYTRDDIRRAFNAPKPCARTCPIAYAHHASRLDGWRAQAGPAIPPPHTGRRSSALAVLA